jgi:hypothetical protein
MTPAQVMERTIADGVYVCLSDTGKIKASGDQAAVERWLPLMREHKQAIITHLKEWEANTGPHWRWRVVFADGSVRIAAFVPPASWLEVLEFYPAAVSGKRIPDDYQFR